jgi:Tol biopolymer transport system component
LIGQTLSHFRITAKLGEGGMGEVYRAQDTKLGREVAIKVLPAAFTEDAERLARFEREAKVLASLSHPNIAGIYQLENIEGQLLLIMELVEGQDLAERLEGGAIGVEEASAIALQLAQGLEAAHERGVIHRDLKPANIKVTADGQVKILDFGLAKAWEEPPEEGSLSMSPTLTAQMTQAGVILGTAAYMSPEQAKGQSADKRADIWSFGVVLWEMLTGRRLFAGDSVSDTLAAVLRDDIDAAELPGDTPTPLRGLLRRCLDRNPKSRLRDIGEARVVLEGPTDIRLTERESEDRKGVLPWKVAIPAAFVIAVLSGLLTWVANSLLAPDHGAQAVVRIAIPMPTGRRLPSPAEFPRVDISADGRTIAYAAFEEATPAIYLQSMDSFEVTKVQGTEGGSGPMLSPDGEWIAFFMAETLYKVPIEGGRAQQIADRTVWDRDAVWIQNDMIIMGGGGAADSFDGGLLSVSAKGGSVQPVSQPGPGEIHVAPTRLPDGSVLFGIRNEKGNHLGRFWPDARTWEDLSIPGEKAWWLEGGFLIVAKSSSFEAYRFDLASGEVMGQPIDVLPGAGEDTLAISSMGTAVYIGHVVGGGGTVVAVDDQGAATPLPIGAGAYRWPRASPDGTRLAIGLRDVAENDERLWVYELGSGRRTSLGPGPCGNLRTEPIWSPDSLQLVTSGGGDCGLLIQRADGSQPPTVLFKPDFAPWPTDWSRDGKQIVFYGNSSGDDNQSIWLLDLEPEASARPVIGGAGPQRLASFSPDGRWLAYASQESGRTEVYAQPLPELDQRWTISAAGGMDPKWAPDGNEIYYRHEDGVYAVTVETQPEFRPGTPRLLFSGPFSHDPNGDQSWDILPDGRFVLILPDEQARRDLRVVIHLAEEIQRKLVN